MNAVISQWIGKREHQEDSYAVRHYPGGTLAIVCDGMGGHQLGDLASQTAVQAFVSAFEQATEGPISHRMKTALDAANDAVACAFRKAGAFGGTTLTAAYVGGGVLWWISVGDSPLYLWRQHRLVRLNADHSLRAVYMQYVQAGSLTFEDAMQRGHSLRSAVTGDRMSMVDAPSTPYPLLPGDRIMLTSDGTDDLLYTPVLSEAAKQVLETRGGNLSADIVAACQALQAPFADNVTVVALDWDV